MTGPTVRAQVSLTHPRADAMDLSEVDERGTLTLALAPAYAACILLGGHDADREADAQAMDRLAELADEAAARLRGQR